MARNRAPVTPGTARSKVGGVNSAGGQSPDSRESDCCLSSCCRTGMT